jgi:hypothetical protein
MAVGNRIPEQGGLEVDQEARLIGDGGLVVQLARKSCV